MPYKVSKRNIFERDLKAFKNDRPLKVQIAEYMQVVIDNPRSGEIMDRDMLDYYKVSFGDHPQYRLIYRRYRCCQDNGGCYFEGQEDVTPCEGGIEFVFIRTREECNHLYKRGKEYFDGLAVEGLEPV